MAFWDITGHKHFLKCSICGTFALFSQKVRYPCDISQIVHSPGPQCMRMREVTMDSRMTYYKEVGRSEIYLIKNT